MMSFVLSLLLLTYIETSRTISLRHLKTIVDVTEEVGGSISDVSATQNNSRKSVYFEVKILDGGRNNNIGIGVKSDTTSTIYHGNAGQIFAASKIINSEQPYGTGDVIGCHVSLEVYKSDTQTYNHCTFAKNGMECAYPVIFEGNAPISVVFLDTYGSEERQIDEVVELNLGEHPFKHSIGNYNAFLYIILMNFNTPDKCNGTIIYCILNLYY